MREFNTMDERLVLSYAYAYLLGVLCIEEERQKEWINDPVAFGQLSRSIKQLKAQISELHERIIDLETQPH